MLSNDTTGQTNFFAFTEHQGYSPPLRKSYFKASSQIWVLALGQASALAAWLTYNPLLVHQQTLVAAVFRIAIYGAKLSICMSPDRALPDPCLDDRPALCPTCPDCGFASKAMTTDIKIAGCLPQVAGPGHVPSSSRVVMKYKCRKATTDSHASNQQTSLVHFAAIQETDIAAKKHTWQTRAYIASSAALTAIAVCDGTS